MAKAKIIISAKKPDTNHDYIEILKTVSIEEARTLSKIFENNSSPTQIARQFKIDESEIPTVKAFLHSKIEHATISYAAIVGSPSESPKSIEASPAGDSIDYSAEHPAPTD